MKLSLNIFILLVALKGLTQSPGLNIYLVMDSMKAGTIHYKIEMKICKPVKMTEKGDWFTHDTSTIQFLSLKPAEIECGNYTGNDSSGLISGHEDKMLTNQFGFINQVFAWEDIFVFKIADWSSRSWHPEMYIVVPMKYKSFITSIRIDDVIFQPGKVIFIEDLKGEYDGMKLNCIHSLKYDKAVDVKSFELKQVLKNQ